MAEEKSRKERLYDNKKKTEKPDAEGTKESHTEKETGPIKSGSGDAEVNSAAGKHAVERKDMQKRHEGERRDQHGQHRDELRSMHQRHEKEHEGAKSADDTKRIHRKHEVEHNDMKARHNNEHLHMRNRHNEERMKMHERHEAELNNNVKAGADVEPVRNMSEQLPADAGNAEEVA